MRQHLVVVGGERINAAGAEHVVHASDGERSKWQVLKLFDQQLLGLAEG